jgi:hypothetical protein
MSLTVSRSARGCIVPVTPVSSPAGRSTAVEGVATLSVVDRDGLTHIFLSQLTGKYIILGDRLFF